MISDEGQRCDVTRPRGGGRPALVTPRSENTLAMSEEKQGLFVEFIQFLIRIGMFNKNVVISMLKNKDLFL